MALTFSLGVLSANSPDADTIRPDARDQQGICKIFLLPGHGMQFCFFTGEIFIGVVTEQFWIPGGGTENCYGY